MTLSKSLLRLGLMPYSLKANIMPCMEAYVVMMM